MATIDHEFPSEFNERYSLVSRKIVRMLSEDSRISVSDMAKNIKMSRQSIVERLGRLNEELGLRYTLELNEDALGLSDPHLILVTFSKKPDYEYIKKIFEKSHIPQLVAIFKNGYDMIIYANATSRQEYVHWDKSMQILLSDYGVSWKASEVAHRQLGFFPIRNELIDKLKLAPKYKEMIKLLNSNSRASFQDLSKKLGMHFNTVAYNFKKLEGMGYIKRFTIMMEQQENICFMSNFGKYVISRSFEEDAARERKALMSDDENSMISRYILCCQLVGSYDFFSVGAFDSLKVALKHDIAYYRRAMANEKPRTEFGEIERVLVGSLPVRSLEAKKVFDTIRWTPT